MWPFADDFIVVMEPKGPMKQNAPYDARAVAAFSPDLATQKKIVLTQLSLLKLLYFAHGWYLVYFAQPLVRQDFKAWKYGPVVEETPANRRGIWKPTDLEFSYCIKYFFWQTRSRSSNLSAVVSTSSRTFRFLPSLRCLDLSEITHEARSPRELGYRRTCRPTRLSIKNEEIKPTFVGLHRRLRLA